MLPHSRGVRMSLGVPGANRTHDLSLNVGVFRLELSLGLKIE